MIQRFLNLKIATKLMVAFFVNISLTLTLGCFALLQLGVINNLLADIQVKNLPAVRYSSAMNTNASDFRIAEYQHILASTAEERGEYEKVMREVLVDFERNRAAYLSGVTATNDQQLYDKFNAEWSEYLIRHQQVLDLSNEDKDSEARKLMASLSRERYERSGEALQKIVDLNTTLARAVAEQGSSTYSKARYKMVAMLILIVALNLGIVLLLARSISRPLRRAVEVARTVAAGDLTSTIDVRSTDESGQLLSTLRDMNDSLANMVRQVLEGTAVMALASKQIKSGNDDLSSRTEEQASALQQTASSMEQMTSIVQHNAESSQRASKLATGATEVALEGGAVVAEVVGVMGEINESARKIVDIIGVIDGIAFQTNILALNAAVEAARAGEQGRGFAVVATEVRNLAQRSAAAAKQIKDLIDNSMQKVDLGSRLVGRAGVTMEEIVESIQRVKNMVGEISAGSQEQAIGIEQINRAIAQMDQATQKNSELVEECANASGELQLQASTLSNTVALFKIDQTALVITPQARGKHSFAQLIAP